MAIHEYTLNAPVVFGAGAIGKIGEKVRSMGCKRAMCVCDEGVKNAGILDIVMSFLREAGIETIVFDAVLPDPPSTIINDAGDLARKTGIDCVIGIGGGSSMDTAKAVSILQKHGGSITDYLNLQGPPFFVDGGVPVILAPTSAGTGSEVTNICVVSHVERNEKIVVLTNVSQAIVDPELCRTAPPDVTANGGFDALSHAAEAITAKEWNPFSELLGLAAIRRIREYLPAACKDGNDKRAREELSLASNWAGIAFASTNVHVGHAATDSISIIFHTPHGLNCAWVTPAVLEMCSETVPEKVKLIGEALGVVFIGNESTGEIGRIASEACRALMRQCGIRPMESYGLSREKVLSGANNMLSNGLCLNSPMEITGATAEKLLASAYDNYGSD